MKKRIRQWVPSFIGIIFLLCVIYAGIKIVQINKEYPQVEVVKVDAGEKEAIQQDVEMKVMDVKMLSMNEAELKYGEDFVNEVGQDFSYRIVEVYVSLENVGNEEQGIPLYNIYIEKVDYCNGLAPEVFFSVDNESDYITLQGKEAKTVILGYLLYEKQFGEKEWENMSVSDFYLTVDRYPVKTEWMLGGVYI